VIPFVTSVVDKLFEQASSFDLMNLEEKLCLN
jgi:hypothetical protein